MKTTINKLQPVKFHWNFALVFVFVFSFAVAPTQASNIGDNHEKSPRIISSEQSLSQSFSESESQIEEDMEIELWMLNPKHTSWFASEEKDIALARWMTDINSRGWMNDTAKEARLDLQNWMLLPNEWLQ